VRLVQSHCSAPFANAVIAHEHMLNAADTEKKQNNVTDLLAEKPARNVY
jgi:hypothetical protein